MDVKFFKMDEYYCDIGDHEGKTAVRIKATVYLDEEELAQYKASGGYRLDITIPEKDNDGTQQ